MTRLSESRVQLICTDSLEVHRGKSCSDEGNLIANMGMVKGQGTETEVTVKQTAGNTG
jgi:hypothetical protein